MGKEERKEMNYWTVDEYSKFSNEMMDKPISYYAFQMLYWTGIRVGELLALTAGDFDFENGTVTTNKSYQRTAPRRCCNSTKNGEEQQNNKNATAFM